METTTQQQHWAEQGVEPERFSFHSLVAANPNYFGTVPDIGFEAVLEKASDSGYEALSCVSFNPETDRLEATVQIRRPYGYLGGLCTAGSHENVRFYISYDNGVQWTDVGLASFAVHDIAGGKSCDGSTWPPLSYVCGVQLTPRREPCKVPVLPLVRAILSWESVPLPNTPDQQPIWGDVHECHIQVRPSVKIIIEKPSVLTAGILHPLPNYAVQTPGWPIPDPGPLTPLSLPELAVLYQHAKVAAEQESVPVHRFALQHLLASSAENVPQAQLVSSALVAKEIGINLSEVLKNLESTSGNTSYEELECLGLDNNTDQLVGSFRVKRPSGFSGGPCSPGSTEYVAYWADFGEDCTYTYLGTVKVSTHDYPTLPAGGLCYAAPLPVDLGQFRRECGKPVIGRVRAVLSWGTPPSTTDPDALPYWGNRMDVHVQLRPGRPYDGSAYFTIVGGVAAASIDNVTGETLAGTVIAENGQAVGFGAAFGSGVSLHGPLDPSLAPQQYRILARDVTVGGTFGPLTGTFYVVNQYGVGSSVTPGAGGWSAWPTWQDNTTGMLGLFPSAGDDLWEFALELSGVGVVATKRVQLDNTLNASIVAGDTVNAAALQLNTFAECRVPKAPLTGTFVARDKHFLSWSITVVGGPSGGVFHLPVVTTPFLTTAQETAFSGQQFTIDLSSLESCGYVVELDVSDRVVQDSAYFGRSVPVYRGICVE
ncbi:helix-hairpin-helix domain-containing protein [Acidothermaceae bacterium B102]|nr:helix-hairpin-helix domain-containing protein [Acidothermaceae bacterium B102]